MKLEKDQITIVRAGEGRETLWRNGRGRSWHLAASTDGTDKQDFDWIVSIAILDGEQPFSAYPGVHRTLSIIGGVGMRIAMDGREFELTTETGPLAFEGELQVLGRALGGEPVKDFNVLTNRSRASHVSTRVVIAGRTEVHVTGDITIIHVQTGSATTSINRESIELLSGDTIVVQPRSLNEIAVDGDATLLLSAIKLKQQQT